MTIKERTALISLVASFSLAIIKLVVGLAIGSLALITDALHSGVDFAATCITLLAVHWGDRPPDANHPYGHGKFENVAALGEAGLLLLLAGAVTWEAVLQLAEGAAPPDLALIAVIVLLGEMGINLWRAAALRRVGRQTKSAALLADSLHFGSDVLSSLAVLAGFALVWAGFDWGDAAGAIGVAALISVLALRLLKHTIDELVDRAPDGVPALLRERIADVPGVLGVENVRARTVGPKHFVDATIHVPRSLGIEQAAEVKAAVVAQACAVLPDAEVTVQSVPVSPSDETIHDRVNLVALREGVATHHVTVHHLGERLAIALDLEVEGRLPLSQAHATADRLEAAIRREFGAATEIEIHIEPLEPETRDVEAASKEERAVYEAALERAAGSIDGLEDIHNVRLRESERGYVLVAHCRLDPAETVESVHRRVDELEGRMRTAHPEIVRIVLHAEPICAKG